jgi:isopentenyl-diphosphate delta-isomerase
MEEVVLVNELDESTGTMEKMEAHRKPILHRAFSVFLFNNQQKMLLQQRAHAKYHSGGLWTNACCSHPRPGEDTFAAATRRIKEELGIDTNIDFAFHFIYQAAFENGLHEYEFDHVFTGTYNGKLQPNPSEVAAYCYKSIEEIKDDLLVKPQLYTEWFKIALPKLEEYLSANKIG